MGDQGDDGDTGSQGEQGGGQGDHGGSGGGDGAFTAEQLAEIRQVVRDALGGLGPAGQGVGSGEGDHGAGDGGAPPTGGRLIDQEAHWEQVVRRELEKVKAGEKLGSLEEQVKKIMEQPPKRYRKITEAMWGKGGDE